MKYVLEKHGAVFLYWLFWIKFLLSKVYYEGSLLWGIRKRVLQIFNFNSLENKTNYVFPICGGNCGNTRNRMVEKTCFLSQRASSLAEVRAMKQINTAQMKTAAELSWTKVWALGLNSLDHILFALTTCIILDKLLKGLVSQCYIWKWKG